MNLYFDNIIFSHVKNGGVSNYWYNLINYINAETDANVSFFEGSDAKLNFHRRKLELSPEKIITTKSNTISRLFPINYAIAEENAIFHSSYYRDVKSNRGKEVTTIHDFTHNFYASAHKKRLHNFFKYSSTRRADGIICISQSTYNDLKKFVTLKKNQKVEIIYNGVSNAYHPVEKGVSQTATLQGLYGLNEKYLLYVGGRISYKNFYLAIDILKKLPDHRLYVVGSALSKSEEKYVGINTLQRIRVFKNPEDSLLNLLYNYATALIYPSLYEGFGIPVIEAMKAGCPVLALNRSSIPEIANGAALLYDNPDGNDFLRGICLLENKDFRDDLIGRGLENSQKFSWHKCASETYSFYKELVL
ncbi:MAG: glycosyltransferase family 4 protein [Flavobacterium sp.]